jgi:hypothetical protein
MSGLAVLVLSGVLGSAVSVSAPIRRSRQYAMDSGVCGTLPYRTAIGSPDRQLEIVFQKPKKRLPNTAQFSKLGEHRQHRLLNAAIRIFFEPIFRLNVSDWRTDDQFATPRFFSSGLPGTLPQQIQFVFVQTPF